MAAKPAPKKTGHTGKHATPAAKHGTKPNGGAKHNVNAKPVKGGGGKPAKGQHKSAAKHHPAHKPVHHETLSHQVERLVAQDVAKTLKKMGVKPRGAALMLDDAPMCAAEALAASLRMAGKPVGADDTWTLFLHAGGDQDTPVTIWDALMAAETHGLAGAYPLFRPARGLADGVVAGLTLPIGGHAVTIDRGGVRTWGEWRPARRTLETLIEEAWVISWQ